MNTVRITVFRGDERIKTFRYDSKTDADRVYCELVDTLDQLGAVDTEELGTQDGCYQYEASQIDGNNVIGWSILYVPTGARNYG